jgi:hypothetical protein
MLVQEWLVALMSVAVLDKAIVAAGAKAIVAVGPKMYGICVLCGELRRGGSCKT